MVVTFIICYFRVDPDLVQIFLRLYSGFFWVGYGSGIFLRVGYGPAFCSRIIPGSVKFSPVFAALVATGLRFGPRFF